MLTRAWKPVTFAVGLGWLIWGALFFGYPDWDIRLSLLMAGCTYLTADWFVSVVKQRRYSLWPLALLACWFSVDGVYWLYWSLVRPEVMIRDGQWPMSLCLYLLCGFCWTITPSEVMGAVRAPLQRGRVPPSAATRWPPQRWKGQAPEDDTRV